MSGEYAFLDTAAAREALAAQVGRVRERPARIGALFPAAARSVARGAGPSGDPDGVAGPTLEDLVRVELLTALSGALTPPELAREVRGLYHHGDAGERRAVLRGLDVLDVLGAGREELAGAARELLADAMRTNDTRLVAAAASSAATALLDAESWRQGILKCLFTGVPLESAAGLPDRADAELARMCADHAEERVLAGRPVPADVHLVLRRFPGQAARLDTHRTEA
ncbi:EboA domain-containing protein [Nocardiopsis alborubida]|uniref:Sugar phosphate isomerase n=1 Tax=Nocardiopsis alborubida TaxID=146802 RepID=A0A7X6RR88_9ACTN|nr:EboA domain-containing protein [Nocardiopsis alborubida]NKY99443.1 sugar phosphate isomerase [Nocardiopsis alborubida]